MTGYVATESRDTCMPSFGMRDGRFGFDHAVVSQWTSEKSTFDIGAPHQNTIIAFALSLLSLSLPPSSSALVPDSRPFIHVVPQFAPGKSLRLDQLCDFVFTPLLSFPSHSLSTSADARFCLGHRAARSFAQFSQLSFLPSEIEPLSQHFRGVNQQK